jgi:alpha-galactosidase
MAGTFGYELDLTKLTDEECEEIREQIKRYIEIEPVVHDGDLYRLSDPSANSRYYCWEHVSRDKSRCILSAVVTDPQANYTLIHVKLKGLDPDAMYSVGGEFECKGKTLMQNGYTFTQITGDYPARQIDITRI